MTTQGIETGTAETEGLGAKHESPVGAADAQNSAANPPLAVTDADRSEAADLLLIVGFSLEYIAETKAGSHDDHAFVQAFARHRLATQTPNAAALVGALDLAARELEAQANDPDQEMAIKAAAAARQALAASSPPTQGSGGPSRLHISLCADLRAGKNVGLEAAAAIESLGRELSSTSSNTQGALEAAAPDLLAALKLVVGRCGPDSTDGKIARAAIAKAEGRT